MQDSGGAYRKSPWAVMQAPSPTPAPELPGEMDPSISEGYTEVVKGLELLKNENVDGLGFVAYKKLIDMGMPVRDAVNQVVEKYGQPVEDYYPPEASLFPRKGK